MNTERPDNDDTTGTSGDVRGVGDAAKGSAKGPEVDDTGAGGESAGDGRSPLSKAADATADAGEGGDTAEGDRGASDAETGRREEAGSTASGAEAGPGRPDEAGPVASGVEADHPEEIDRSGSGTEADPSGSGTEIDPSGSGTEADRSGSGTEIDPSGSGTEIDPSGSGTEIDPSGSATENDPSGSGTEADPSEDRSEGARLAASGTESDAEAGRPGVAGPTPPAAAHPEGSTSTADTDLPLRDHSPEPDDRRPARSRSPLVIASVAAAVLLVGGGGAYLASSSSGSGGSGEGTGSAASGADGTPPPLALDGYSSGGTSGIASGEPNPYGETYRAAGSLPGGPESAAVYVPQGEVTKDAVSRLAKALGVMGTPVAEGQVWKVGGQDGSGPSLQVNKAAPGMWTFNRYAPGTDDCTGTLKCTHDPGTSATDPVSAAVAEKAAAPILKAVGQDDAKIDASQLMGAQRVVNAEPVVGGLPTHGWTTGLTVSAQGEVVGGSGELAAPVKSDVYPVLSARKTLDLMNAAPRTDHRMGIGGCASPVPLKDRLEAPCGSSTASAATPTQASTTVEHAVFGLAVHSVDGKQTLVPSWLFEARQPGGQDTFTVTYPAIDPKYLASADTPTPTASSTSTAAPHDIKADGYTTDGKSLTVAFTGGVCADYKASAVESSDKVTVTVTDTPWPDKVCIMIAKIYHQTVQLKAPVGDRKVVGPDGTAIPVEKRVEVGAGPSLAR
ncbi:DUF4573 domain-containing protein [Streptomyces sp. NPDC058469]|uniref:DUF4573 domain-containing protein n=1 Tax=Streptomyces sp. NPDC058469 TaxID=3346514 RepID=UPI0036690765